jgi:PAS domain S-box-containing protein
MISVLCVDDDPAFLSLQKRCLEVPGVMTVTTVLSAPEALKEMETNRFDAIVSDYKIPGIDGIELLREVRAAHPGLPFILYTGKGREEVIIEALNSGADFYLRKNGEPKIQFAELKDTIFKAVKIGELWQALHDSETRYRRLFETAQDGILILDADTGQIVEVNPFLIDLLGFSREQFLGKKIWEIGLFKDIVANKDNFEELQRQEYIRYEDLPLKTSDGQRIAVEFVSNVYTVNNKKVIQCSIRDITERKLVEEERARLAAIVEYSEDAIIGKTLDGIMTSWNAGAERIYGYSPQEMVGKSISLLVPPDHPDDTGLIFERIRNGEPVIRYETLRRKKDGGLINISLTASQIRDTQNRLIGVSTIAHDITKRKLVEEALHVTETRYRRLFETAQDGILILDADTGQIVEVNPFLIDLLGFSREQFLGKKIWEIGLFKDIVANKDNFEELQRQEYIRYEDLPLETSDGQRIAVEFVSNVYTVNNKKVIQCSIRDITERKQVEDALKESEKKFRERTRELSDANTKLQELDRLKSLFIASMSHELRTPLNSIIGFTGIMIKGMAGEINAEQEKQLGMVQDSARHLLALINDVIDISKIEAGKIEASASTFNLADLIREVRTTFGPAAQDRGLVLNIEIPGPLAVTSDERRIKQNIMNLVSNAIKFTDEGRVDLTVEQKGTVVEVRVRDTGIGIRQDDLSQLFRPFVRVMVPGRLSEGTGLGLYLSKKLARLLGGDITAESEIHKGSVFTFSFPIMYEKQEDI